MDILSQATGGTWKSVEENGNHVAAEEGAIRKKTIHLLTSLLLSENLLVLSGLGTSMYLKTHDGDNLCPSMATLWSRAKIKAGNEFSSILNAVHYSIENGSDGNIEDLLSHCQMLLQLKADTSVKKFVNETEGIIAKACRFPVNDVVRPEFHESFLRKVARRSPRLPRTRIFTTNYDLCFEVAASNTRFIMIDGFSHTFPQEFDGSYFSYDLVKREQNRETPDYITNVFHLYKMHGSVDWERNEDRIVKKTSTTNPCLIYPRQGKYQSSYDQPFGEMMGRFQMALRQPNTSLLICGFGFNDAHIVQPIMSAIRSNVSLRVLVVNPDTEKLSQQPDMRKKEIQGIEALIAHGDPRLTLLTAKFENFVSMIPDLVAATEEEVHSQRFRSI